MYEKVVQSNWVIARESAPAPLAKMLVVTLSNFKF